MTACVEAGARSVTAIMLHLRPGVREHFLGWLRPRDPELAEDYERRYQRAYLPGRGAEGAGRPGPRDRRAGRRDVHDASRRPRPDVRRRPGRARSAGRTGRVPARGAVSG